MPSLRRAPLVVLPALLLTGCSFSFSVGGGESASPAPTIGQTSTAPEPGASAPGTPAAGSVEADPEAIAESTENRLEEMVGTRPFVDCGSDPVVVVVGYTHVCTLMAEGDDARYDVTVTFTSLAGDGSFDFDFQVADEPR